MHLISIRMFNVFYCTLNKSKIVIIKKKKKRVQNCFTSSFHLTSSLKFDSRFNIDVWDYSEKKYIYIYIDISFFQYWIVRSGWLLKSQHIWRHQIQYWVASCKLPNANLVTSAYLRWSWSQRGNQRTLRIAFFYFPCHIFSLLFN